MKTTHHSPAASDASHALRQAFSYLVEGLIDVIATVNVPLPPSPDKVCNDAGPATSMFDKQADAIRTGGPPPTAAGREEMARAFPLDDAPSFEGILGKVFLENLGRRGKRRKKSLNAVMREAKARWEAVNNPYPLGSHPSPVVASPAITKQVKREVKKRKAKSK